MKEIKKTSFGTLFCPGYQNNAVSIKRNSKIAKKFLNTVMGTVNEIEQLGNTAQFKHEIGIARKTLRKESYITSEQDLILEAKQCVLEESLDEIFTTLHFDQAFTKTALHQIKKNISNIYRDSFELFKWFNKTTFDERINILIDNILDHMNHFVSNATGINNINPRDKSKKLKF